MSGAPKSWHCQKGGGSLTHAKIFLVNLNNILPGFWNMRALSIVASRIYALFVAKSTSVPGLGVKPILAMPGFWKRLALQPLPKMC